MNKMIKHLLIIFVSIYYSCNMSYACTTPPFADIVNDDIQYTVTYTNVYFNGVGTINVDGSSDPDYDDENWGGGLGIPTNGYWWDFYGTGNLVNAVDGIIYGGTPHMGYRLAGEYEVSLGVIDGGGTPETGMLSENLDTCIVRVCKVAAPFWRQIPVSGSWSIQGETTYVPINEAIRISASSSPSAGLEYAQYFPKGEPHWSIIDAPYGVDVNNIASVDSNTCCIGGGNNTLTFTNGFSVPGKYTVNAHAGNYDFGESINIIAYDGVITGIEGTTGNVLKYGEGGTFLYNVGPDLEWNPDAVLFKIFQNPDYPVYSTNLSTEVGSGLEFAWNGNTAGNEAVTTGKYYIQLKVEKDGEKYESDILPIYIVDVNLTAYKPDGFTAISDTDEENIGAFVARNYYTNDDNDLLRDSLDTYVPGEKDLIKMRFNFDLDEDSFNNLNTGIIVIERENNQIKLWKQKEKGSGQEIVFSSSNKKTYDLSVPIEKESFWHHIDNNDLWVEGYSSSLLSKGTGIKLSYTDASNNEICSDIVEITVVGLDLRSYFTSDPNDPNYLSFDKKIDPGSYILYNNDDDNGNEIIDACDPGPTTNENDLWKVYFAFAWDLFHNNLETGKVVIERSNDKLKLWRDNTRTNPMTFDVNNQIIYDLSISAQRIDFRTNVQSNNFYAEGAAGSSSPRDTGLTLKYLDSDNAEVCVSPVKYTVLTIGLETEEDVISYGTEMDFTYSIMPVSGWSADQINLQIKRNENIVRNVNLTSNGIGTGLSYTWNGNDDDGESAGWGVFTACLYVSKSNEIFTSQIKEFKIIYLYDLKPNKGIVIDDGDEDDHTNTWFVSIDGPNTIVTVTAYTWPPVTSEEELPSDWTLTGGDGTGQVERTVSQDNTHDVEISCTCGTSSESVKIYIYEAKLSLYADEGNGVWPPLNDDPWGHSWWSLSLDENTNELFDYSTPLGILVRYYQKQAGWFSTELSQRYPPYLTGPGRLDFGNQFHPITGQKEWIIDWEHFLSALYAVEVLDTIGGYWQAFSSNCTDMAILIGEIAGIETLDIDELNTPKELSDYLNELEE